MSGQQPPYGYPPPYPPGPPQGPPPGQPFGPPPGPPAGRSNAVLALVITAAMLVIGGIGLAAVLLLGGDGGDDPTPVAAIRTTEPPEPTGPTGPTETSGSAGPTEPGPTEPEPTEPEPTEPTRTPEVTQPAGPPFELDPGDAYATPRNVAAAYVSALFEGDCGNVHAYATADNKRLARQCDRDPTTYLGSRIDDIGEPVGTLDATVSQVAVEATLAGSQEPLVLVFETTDVDGNWLVSDLLSLE